MRIQPSTTVLLCIGLLHLTASILFAAATTVMSETSGDIQGSEQDRVALLAFKSNINIHPQGPMASWNTSLHFCHWPGVTCGRQHHHKRVTGLTLLDAGLSGTLSPYIGNLSFLAQLNLANNSFTGRIPSNIGRLVRLKILYLQNNLFEGEIVSSIFLHCTSLVKLNLGTNMLAGRIPDEIGYLSKLEFFSIFENNFTGPIPTSIGNLTSLRILSASYNKLDGDIPDVFHRLNNNLTVLGFSTNELVGTIPASIYNLSRINFLSFAGNRLHGKLRQDLGLLFPDISFLQLRGNNFTGNIPHTLSNASNLEFLEHSMNSLDGKLVLDFSGMHKLSILSIDTNNLAGDVNFLTSLLINCTNLKDVQLVDNSFSGELPKYIGNNYNISSRITNLNIGWNQLSGTIPSWIGALGDLTSLSMFGNKFFGPIPNSVGMLKYLNRLLLGGNKLSGSIPTSIGNLSSLILLSLGSNALVGAVPSSLGNCQNLLGLQLSKNHLSGQIPKQLFNISSLSIALDLSRNRFVGPLPTEVGNLNNLGILNVSENQLSGEIPSSIGGCISLEVLLLQGNLFQGLIPESLSSLKGIRKLDLSRNNLTGVIPDYFAGFSLGYLNLSYNDLEGDVPRRGVFMKNASVLLSLAGNNKLCGGVPQLNLPKCRPIKAAKKKKEHSKSLVAIIITSSLFGVLAVCGAAALIYYYYYYYFRYKEDRKIKISHDDPTTLMKVSYAMLLKATNGFSAANVIGVGGFGTVYRGIIIEPDEQIVAIKVLNLQRRGSSKSFAAECEALRSIRHRNLLKVITSCSSVDFKGNDFKALVYEFMPNGSLDTWLHNAASASDGQPRNLNLNQIINIVTDVASVLEYLHRQCEPAVIHCDLKPSNILLDSDMNAHVGDFGLAKILEEFTTPNESSSIGIRGTIGYTAPEYGIGSMVSTSGDVYSFGIVLLELMTGKNPTSSTFEQGQSLHDFAKAALVDHDGIMEIVDPMLLLISSNNIDAATINRMEECIVSMVKIGVACTVESPQTRLDITDVVRQLHFSGMYLNNLTLDKDVVCS